MINFNFIDVKFDFDKKKILDWLQQVILSEGKKTGDINYVFCGDEYLLDINKKFLDHNHYTDIITFDNTLGNVLGADIYISSDRVKDNSIEYGVSFENELLRVIVHGVLHLCGYKDKSKEEAKIMRSKEDEKIKMFHVEQS